MRFLFIICHDAQFAPSPKLVAGINLWTQRRRKEGVLIHGNPLTPPDEAVTVRARGRKLKLTPGPFAKSREKIAAYVLIKAKSMTDAVSVAAGHPMASVATIEVRPVWEELA